MRLKNIFLFSLSLVISMAFVGCGTVKKLTIPKQNVQRVMGEQDVARAISKALTKKKWSYKADPKSKTIIASIHKSGWDFKVSIVYSKNSYKINYDSSHNLKYNAKSNTIHPVYNVYVSQLNRQVKYELKRLKVIKKVEEEKPSVVKEDREVPTPHNTIEDKKPRKEKPDVSPKREEEILTPIEIW
jgi:uncharacterized protein YceK